MGLFSDLYWRSISKEIFTRVESTLLIQYCLEKDIQ